MVGYYNKGVPTTVDLENNSNQKKYTVNQHGGGLHISKALCALMAIGAILLAVLVGLIVFFLIPRSECALDRVENLTKDAFMKADEIDERLPSDIEPTHYRIRIIPNFVSETTKGAVTMKLRVLKETDAIIFHINEININKCSVYVNNSSPLSIRTQSPIEGHRYKITMNDPLKVGQEYLLDVEFTGELNKHLQGFYRMSYYQYDKKITAASTQFSPTDARRAFPCFDEPRFKAYFTISVGRPSNMTSLSNMPLDKSELINDQPGWYWDHYGETPKMSTYLVAFLVATLTTRNSQTNFIRIWSQDGLLQQTGFANEISPKMLNFFEDYFKIKFPLPKIDIVAVPEFGFNAMENWGLITFRESSLLYNNTTTTTIDQTDTAKILGHEIAHQWFGNLVTPKWWNDLWLKEGFATYLEYLAVDHALPEWKFMDEFDVETRKSFQLDALESSRPISFSVVNHKQIRQTFDAISYSKGACIIRMMANFLGEEAFKTGLINFLNKYKYSNADRNDLFTILTEEAHKAGVLDPKDTVKTIMDTWTEQAGFPVITAIADYQRKTLQLSQKRFLFTSSKEYPSTWWVPISLTSDIQKEPPSTRPKFWLKGEKRLETSLDSNDWYLLNLNQTGYYIVNYDEQNWRSIINHIMDFPPLTRAQLISDSMDLARANLLDYDIPLKLIARMAVQDSQIMFIPTKIAFEKLKFLSDQLHNTPAFGLFEEYHNDIFKSTYSVVDFNDNVMDDYLTKRIRSEVLEWSCRSSESKCAYEARNLYRTWMAQPSNTIPPNLRSIFYCTAIRDGSKYDWDFAYDQYVKTQIPAEKEILLDALGCTKEKWLLSKFLDLLIDEPSSIRIQDADRVFDSIARRKVGTSIAFDFLRKNWNKINEHFGEGFNLISKMVKAIANNMNTQFQLEEFKRFRDSIQSNTTTTGQAFEYAIETIKANSEWMKKNYESVEHWLTAHRGNYNL